MKVAVRYGDKVDAAAREGRQRPGRLRGAAQGAGARAGRVDRSALHQARRRCAIRAGDSAARCKDRCIGVFDLESPELDAFKKSHVEILTLLASQAAVAIENARLYETIRANEVRLEKELRFAQRVQAALLPTELPKRLQGRRRRGAIRAGARARRRSLRLPGAGTEQSGRRRRRRVGQGRAGGALQRVCRRAGPVADVPAPLRARALQPGRRARLDEHDPPRAAARGVLLHALLRGVRLQAAHGRAGQLRSAVSDSLRPAPTERRRASRAGKSSCPACRSDRFPARPTTRSRFDLAAGDLFVFCTDGVFEASDAAGRGIRRRRGCWTVVERNASADRAREIVDAIFAAVQEFRGDAPPNDDMTAVGDQDHQRDVRRQDSRVCLSLGLHVERSPRAGAGRAPGRRTPRPRSPRPLTRTRAPAGRRPAALATAPSPRRSHRRPCTAGTARAERPTTW